MRSRSMHFFPSRGPICFSPGSAIRRKLISTVLLLMGLMGCLIGTTSSLDAYPIDLNGLPVYIKRGFDSSTLTGPTNLENLKLWRRLEPTAARPISITDLHLEGVPVRRFPETRTLSPEDFTFLFFFDLTEADLENMRNPVLLLAQIGESWKIYLNGELVHESEKEAAANKRLLRVPLNPRVLHSGQNQLVLRVTGNPLSPETGLFYGQPYRIEEAAAAEEETGQTLHIVLITIYAGVGIFHVFFWLNDRKRIYNLFFGIFAISLATFIYSRSTLPYVFTNNAIVLLRMELSSVAFAVPLFSSFLISIITHQSRAFKWFHAFVRAHGWTVAGLALVLPTNLLYDLLLVWQSSVPPIIVGLEVFLLYFFARDLRQFIRRDGLRKGIYHAIVLRVSGNLVIGSIFMFSTSLYDILVALVYRTSPGTSFYGFLIFLSGAAIRIAYDLLHLLNTNQKLNRSLKANLMHAKRMHRTLSLSESRYRKLIEATAEIILTLDDRGIVTTANGSLFRELGIHPSDVMGREFTELLEREGPESSYSHSYTADRVRKFYESGEALKIRIPFFASQKKSHILYDVRFEKIGIAGISDGGQTEIFVKATPIEEDPALRFLLRETIHFEMDNDLYAIEDVIRRLIADLPRFLNEYEISMIRIGLRETIVNAIEHGNLGITYNEKSRLLNSGIYHEEIRRRISSSEHTSRRVRIQQTLTPRRLIYRITDGGEGFDHANFKAALEQEDAAVALHGRGIFITRNAFTRVYYNTQGNSVLLVRDLPDRTSPGPEREVSRGQETDSTGGRGEWMA